jgi:hypothetical protein
MAAMKEPEGHVNPELVSIGALIRAFRGQLEEFITYAGPEPPEAA